MNKNKTFKSDEGLSVEAMRNKLRAKGTSTAMKKKLTSSINARKWKRQDGGMVEYAAGGMAISAISQGFDQTGSMMSDAFKEDNAWGQGASGFVSGMSKGPIGALLGAIQGHKQALAVGEQNRFMEEARLKGIQDNQSAINMSGISSYPDGGLVGQLNRSINPTSTSTANPNSMYEISKRYGRTRLASTKDAGQNTSNKRWYYNVKDINSGLTRDLSLEEMMLQFPNYKDTPGLGAYPMGGLIPYDQPNAELEKEEVTAAPDGSMAKFNLPTHGEATADNQMALEPGTRVFSDRLKSSSGKTFAEEADAIRKEIMKYEQILYT